MHKLLLAAALLISVPLFAVAQLTVQTTKDEYQFGETIVVTWSGDSGDSSTRLGLFVPNQCSDISNDCVDSDTYPLNVYTELTSESGSHQFNRDFGPFRRFWGAVEVRAWLAADSTVLFQKNVTVIGNASLSTPTIFFGVETAIRWAVSSPSHSVYDFIGIFPAAGCENVDDSSCVLQWTYADQDLAGWWNITLSPTEGLNTSASYILAYVLYGDGVEAPELLSGRRRFLAQTAPFQLTFSGAIQASKSQFSIWEPISIQWSANSGHNEYDCVKYWKTGANIVNDAPVRGDWVPAGASGTLLLEGTPEPGDYTAYYLGSCEPTYVSGTPVSFTVIANVTLSTATTIFKQNTMFAVNVRTSGFQGYNDQVSVYNRFCDTAEKVRSINDTSECQLIGYVSFVPNKVANTKVSVMAPDAIVGDAGFRVWYMADYTWPVAQVGPLRASIMAGTCATSCANQNTRCGKAADCTSCGSASEPCVALPVPTLTGATPIDGWEASVFPGGAEGVVNFTIEALDNGYGPLELDQTGFSQDAIDSGAVTITRSTIAGGSKWVVRWQTQPLDENLYVWFCFSVINSASVFTDTRCYSLQTRGRNCQSFGDPHMRTFDAVSYDFMGYGDFFLVKSRTFDSDKFSVQVRYHSCSGSRGGPSCNKAIGFTDSNSKFAIYFAEDANPKYQYNGQPFAELEEEANITLPNGAQLTRYYTDLYVVLRTGIYMQIWGLTSPTNNLQIKIPSGEWKDKVYGLCGAWDNNQAGDFLFSNGTTLPDDADESRQYSWGLTWQVNATESVFNYTAVGFASYAEANSPNTGYAPAQWSSDNFRESAETLCSNILGLAADEYDACLFDIRATDSLEAGAAAASAFISACSQKPDSQQTAACSLNQACPNRCNFMGTCNNGACQCYGGYGGPDCSIKPGAPGAPPTSSSPSGPAPVAAPAKPVVKTGEPPNMAPQTTASVAFFFVLALLVAML